MGPTAAGKTALAVAAHERLGCELISVDSALVYRGMDIGTAKPDAALQARAPHRLIDLREPWQPYSAADFAADANEAIDDILRQGRTPLLVGGTMLYFRALTEGLSSLPEADAAVRERLEGEAAAQGWPAMHRRLASVDPEAAARITANDSQRIQRALEVYELSGRPLSALQTGGEGGRAARYLKLIVAPTDRKLLHQRIAGRFGQMLQEGFLDEVRRLRQDPRIQPGLPAMRAVGYRQAWQYLDGELAAEAWEQSAIAATRQLAKRQLTWLRKIDDGIRVDSGRPGWTEDALNQIAQFLHISLC